MTGAGGAVCDGGSVSMSWMLDDIAGDPIDQAITSRWVPLTGEPVRIDRRFETGLAAQQGAGSRIERRRSAAFGNDAVRHATVIVDGQKHADDSALILLCGAGRIVTGLKGQVQKPGWLREGAGC